jgi:multidrug resistance efflux pump
METNLLMERSRRIASPPPPTQTAVATEALESSVRSRGRRWLFRGLRLTAAGALLGGAAMLTRVQVTTVSSDQAYLNGSITALRTPITGVLALETTEPGMRLPAGASVFHIENSRFGNGDSMAQLNWNQELLERFRVELAEAELRLARQFELFGYHEVLFKDNMIPRMQYLEEESKVAICRIVANNRKEQLRAAEVRSREIEQQLALQKQAEVTMPFDGIVWAVRAQHGSHIAANEPVLQVLDPRKLWVDAFFHERHAEKLQIGAGVFVRAVDGGQSWRGEIESVRAGVGRLDPEHSVAMPPGDLSRRRVAVRVKLTSAAAFSAKEFFGVGRSVKVILPANG